MNEKFSNDDELFAAIMNNDEQAKRVFHSRVIQSLYWLAFKFVNNKMEAEDIASLAFSRSLTSGTQFNDLKHIIYYMRKAVRFACLDHLKKHKNDPSYHVPIEKLEEELANDQNIEEDFIRAEYLQAVYAQINNLPDEQDRRILLLTMDSRSNEEIGEAIGRTPRYVRDRRNVLVKILRNKLIDNDIISVLLLLLLIK